jgi:hypothetical protein
MVLKDPGGWIFCQAISQLKAELLFKAKGWTIPKACERK